MNYTITIFLMCLFSPFIYSMEATVHNEVIQASPLIQLRDYYGSLQEHRTKLLGFGCLDVNNLNAQNTGGETMLEAAARSKEWNLVKLLLLCKADPKKQRITDFPEPHPTETTLHYATQNAQLAIVSLLLSHGAIPDCINIHGTTPLIMAGQDFIRYKKSTHKDIAKSLLNHNASVDLENDQGISFRKLAATNKQLSDLLHKPSHTLSSPKGSKSPAKKARTNTSE